MEWPENEDVSSLNPRLYSSLLHPILSLWLAHLMFFHLRHKSLFQAEHFLLLWLTPLLQIELLLLVHHAWFQFFHSMYVILLPCYSIILCWRLTITSRLWLRSYTLFSSILQPNILGLSWPSSPIFMLVTMLGKAIFILICGDVTKNMATSSDMPQIA